MNLFDLCVYKNLNKGSGGDVDVSSLVATENKTYNAGEGKAYNPVVVNVPTPPPSLQSLTASHNGYFVPSSGYVGFSEVNVDVAAPLETLSATENGTYTPSSGYEGFSEVTVDVPLPNNAYLLESQKDDVVTIQHGAEFDMPKLIASIEPQQSGSGAPSPENVRPISGWTACNVVHCGKNEWGSLPTEYTIGYQGNIIQNSDFPIGVGTYKFIFDTDTPKGQMQLEIFKNSSWQTTDRVYDSGGFNVGNHNELTVTLSESANRLRLFTNSSNGISIKNVKMLDMAHTYTINFVDGSNPLIVYGGTLDVLSGVLTVDRVTQNLGDLTWSTQTTAYSGRSRFKATLSPSAVNSDTTSGVTSLCSSYVALGSGQTYTAESDGYTIADSAILIYIDSYRSSSASDFKTAMDGVQLVYKLATPQTYQLTPTQVIKSLLGVNNIFADTGEVDVQMWTKEA